MSYEDLLAEELADLDREHPNWDYESRVETARHFLKTSALPKETLICLYGKDIIESIENEQKN